MVKVIRYLIPVIILWFLLHIALIVIDGLKDEIAIVDTAVVLGNKVELNGEPSKRLKSRLDRAIELYKKNYFKYIIVSGGIGKEGFDEAKVMRDYLIKNGVNKENIIVDSKGNNTYFTALNSKKISDDKGFNSIMVISQYFHISRTKLAFSKVGFRKVYSAHAYYFGIKDIYSLIREFFAYYKYLLAY